MQELITTEEDTFNLTLDGNQMGLLFAALTGLSGSLEEDPNYVDSPVLENLQELQGLFMSMLMAKQMKVN